MKLHIGCGKRNFGTDWVHIDGEDFSHLQSHDITDLPQADDSVDLVYASHVLEYFDRQEAQAVILEWGRVLKPGGTIRVAVPNFEAMAKLYVEQGIPLHKIIGPLYGRMPMGDQTIYHRTVYDYENMWQLLMNTGFKDVQRYDWRDTEHAEFDDHSQAYLPHMDKENGTLISLNVEATKI